MLDYVAIGGRICAFRRLRNLSQEQLAEKVWISTTHMSHIETGSTKLSLSVLVDLANALEVGTDDILSIQSSEEKAHRKESIQEILDSCTSQQAKAIEEIIRSAKSAMEQYM